MYNRNTIGATAELIVATKLMQDGFDVFQNCCRSGIADLMVLNHETMVTAAVDVKSEMARYVRKDGSLGTNLTTRVKFENGIFYIGYIHETKEFLFPESFYPYMHDGGSLPGSLKLA